MIEEARFYLRGLAHGRKLEAPDAVIGSSPFFTAACLGLRLAREWGCPFIYDMRDLYPESLRLGRIPVPGLLYRYLQGWAKRLHRESSFVVVNQPSLHQALRERLPSENLRMVMNPVELPEGDAPQKTSSSDRLTVGYAGLWGRGYDFPTLLAVIEQADTSKFAFRLIGDGFWTRRVREFAEHSRHSLFIHFGWLPPEKLAAEYASWDIALLPVEPRWCVSMWPAKIPELTAHDIITIMPPQLPLTPFLARSPLILRARQATAEGYLRALNEAGARIRTLAMREREEAREMIRREFAPTQLAGSYAEIIRQAVATKGKDSPQATTPD